MQDRLFLGWLHSTISRPVLLQHVQCQFASSLWQALHRMYSTISYAKIIEFRRLLHTTTRGGQSCNDYFEKMRNITDQVTVIGKLVTDADLTRYVLNRLGSKFNFFIVALTTRLDLVSKSFRVFFSHMSHFCYHSINIRLPPTRLLFMRQTEG
jgi:gag-polypeptide of LTR copia-type